MGFGGWRGVRRREGCRMGCEGWRGVRYRGFFCEKV